jgi:UDP-N-acetylglucosamine 2-epimerase (non-hydrolysing)
MAWSARAWRSPATPRCAGESGARGLVLITLHRRESGGGRLAPVLAELAARARAHPELTFLYPMHPSPHVRALATRELSGLENVTLAGPLPYAEFVAAMRRAALIVTDSGGIQEEAAHLDVPVLLVRERTERPEAVRSGHVTLVGCAPEALRTAFEATLRGRGPRAPSPFGAGRASAAIARRLEAQLAA